MATVIAEAETFSGMTKDGVLNALLNSVLAKLVTTKSKAEVVSHLNFLIDSQSQGSIVITHGC
ncbi:MAG: hypothetical protein ACJAQS_000530 [Porticoccus sp.]